MSRQFNFFAHPDDVTAIEQCLRRTLGDYLTTEAERGLPSQLVPIRRRIPMQCEKSGVAVPFGRCILIVPPWAVHRLRQVPTGRENVSGELIIHTDECPVLEYECAFFDTTNNVGHWGRFFWNFDGRIGTQESKAIDRLFRSLRQSSERFQGSTFLRVFPKAKELIHQYVLNSGAASTNSPYLTA